ncbi:MAG: N-acetylglucosamine-6-phosphate deacetylase [Planctomycetota bacterium]
MQVRELAVDRVVLADSVLAGATVRIADGRIVEVTADPAPAGGRAPGGTLLPGFVDLQVNGGGGRTTAEATDDALAAVARATQAGGAAAFLPTLITAPWPQLLQQVAAVASWCARRQQKPAADEARPLGLHVEGPFLEVPGAHDQCAFVDPTDRRVDELLAAAAGQLRLVTLASSRDGAAAAVRRLRAAGVVVALGHVADPRGFADCVDAGATLVTHLFNAMGPLHHREPGIAGRALDERRLACALIVDGAHVHPAMVRNAFAVLGPDRTVLVTDATAATGMPDGEFRLAAEAVRSTDGVVRDARGNLAGSALTMARAATNFLAMEPRAGTWTLARLCAANPARLLGLDDLGVLAPGRRAEFTRIDADGSVSVVRFGRD